MFRHPRLAIVFLCMFMGDAVFSQDGSAGAALDVADSLFDAGNYEQAISYYKEHLSSLDKGTGGLGDSVVAGCTEMIALCYFKLDKYSEAIEAYLAALDIQRENGDLVSVANTLNNIGLIYKMRGNFDRAIEYYEETIRIDEELNNGDEIAKTLNNIGMVYRDWGKYDKAIEYFDRSLRLESSLDNQAGVSKSLNKMGLVYTDWKKYDQAILNFRESLRIEESLKNEGEVAIRLNNLGKVYFHKGQYDTALLYFEKTLDYQNRKRDLGQIALAQNNIGKVYLAQEKYKDAELYLSLALTIYHQLGKEGEKATALANLSDINRAMGKYDKALQLLDSSTLIADRLNLRNQLQQNYLYYSEIYNARKDYERSLEYYKKHSQLKDSVFSDEILSKLSDFQAKYETEKKEAEIQILRQNELIQGLALKKETIFRNSMLGLSCLLLVLACVIFYSLLLKRKDNRIIAGAMEKSDQLLLNILPAGIASDLKEKGKTEPQLFDHVTVCFVDIVDFTHKSTMLDPKILIEELNQIFTAFDNIIESHSCERIKTIGDSYLAVCGLPMPDPMHAGKIVSSCIEMVRFMKNRNTGAGYKWEIRVGIHSGQVIAGVVGVKKYIYDVFGDTINTASRMQTSSEPMKINISESTYQLIKDQFDTEPRGEHEARGKGKLRMYFVS